MKWGRWLGTKSQALQQLKAVLLKLEPAQGLELSGLPSGELEEVLDEVRRSGFVFQPGTTAARETGGAEPDLAQQGGHTVRLALKPTGTQLAESSSTGDTVFLYVTRVAPDRWTWYREPAR